MDPDRFDGLIRSLTGAASSRRRLLTGVAGGVLGGMLGLRGVEEVAAARTMTASCFAQRAYSRVPGDKRFAQSFTPTIGGKLSRVVVHVRNDPPRTKGTYVLQVLSMVDGKPEPDPANALATGKIRDRDVRIGPLRTLKFNFAKDRAATVQAGTEYAISLSKPGASEFVWWRENDNGCHDGRGFFFDTATGQFVAIEDPEDDFDFVAFVGYP